MKKIILTSLILLNFVFLTKNINAGGYAEPVLIYDETPTTNYSNPVIIYDQQPDNNFPEPSAPQSPEYYSEYYPEYYCDNQNNLYPNLDLETETQSYPTQYFITPPPPAIIINNPEAVSITPKGATPNTSQTVIQQKKSGFLSKISAPFRFMGRTIKKTYEVTKKTFEVTRTLLLITTVLYLVDYFLSLHGFGGHIYTTINKGITLPLHVIKGAKAKALSTENLKSVVEKFKPVANITAKTEKQSFIKYLLNLLKTLITKIIKLICKSKPVGAQALNAVNKTISQQELTFWQKLKAFTINLRSSLNAYQCHQSLNAQAMADMSLSLENLNSLLNSYSQCVSKT